MPAKWRNLSLLAVAELLAMALWFSASAVVPELTAEWGLSGREQSWLTVSVQLGFVLGALGIAVFNLADRLPVHALIAACALMGAALNAGIALVADSLGPALVLRFLTGVTLAGVYPPGMKLVASWCKADRGLWIGVLVGALTVGSAAPHLFTTLGVLGGGGLVSWRTVLLVASGSAALGGALAGAAVRPGSLLPARAPFDWRFATAGLRDPALRLANVGYFGHMWELYAMWSWVTMLLVYSYEQAGLTSTGGRLAGFAVIAIGGVGCLVAGYLADRVGRTVVAGWSMAVSGSCALAAGLFVSSPVLLTLVCLVWGFAVVADSAQFSAAVSELADPRYVGTALTMQTSIGFLLTVISIRLVPPLVDRVGWEWAFTVLALGPAIGVWSMVRLRQHPDSARMASGHR